MALTESLPALSPFGFGYAWLLPCPSQVTSRISVSGPWSKAALGSTPLQDSFSQAPAHPLQNQHPSGYLVEQSPPHPPPLPKLCFLPTNQQLPLVSSLYSALSLMGIPGPQTWLSGACSDFLGTFTLPLVRSSTPSCRGASKTDFSKVQREQGSSPHLRTVLRLRRKKASLLSIACPGPWKLQASELGPRSLGLGILRNGGLGDLRGWGPGQLEAGYPKAWISGSQGS